MNKKRFLAFILDMIILGFISWIIYMIIPDNQNVINLEKELNIVSNNFFNQTINFKEYFNQVISINLDLSKANLLYSILDIVLTIIYFIGLPLNNSNQTLGMKAMKIKLSGDVNFNNLLIRVFIINGVLISLLSIALIYVMSAKAYFITTFILAIIQFVLMVACIVTVVNSKDNRGLHDKLSKTHIEEV